MQLPQCDHSEHVLHHQASLPHRFSIGQKEDERTNDNACYISCDDMQEMMSKVKIIQKKVSASYIFVMELPHFFSLENISDKFEENILDQL